LRIGIIGAGMIGSALAKLWADAGHEACVATRHPEDLKALVQRLGSGASAGRPADAVRFGEVILLAVPLKAVPGLARELASSLAGKVVLDTGNAYQGRDGDVAREATHHQLGSAGWAAALFPGSRWVKAFNTVYFKSLTNSAHRDGARIGIPLAGDDPAALETAAGLVRDAGFDPVIVGALARGREFEPGTTSYNTDLSGPELRHLFGKSH
jgi:predicted dinucleotide-binding enzyme